MIEATHVSKSYGDALALDDVTVTARDGAVTGLVGPNGAGKSTLLRILVGLTVADRGKALVDGRRLIDLPAPGQVAGSFLSAEWIPGHLTARSFLTFVCEVQGLDARDVDRTLQTVGLEHARDRKVKAFSLGMRQRLGIASAIVARPRHLILDEPINGLDPEAIHWLRGLVRSTTAEGGAVILSSHHMSELSIVADDVVMINRGQIVRTGSMRTFVAQQRQQVYFETDHGEVARAVLRARGLQHSPRGDGFVVDDILPEEVGRIMFSDGAGLTHLSKVERTLEETYFDEIRNHDDAVRA